MEGVPPKSLFSSSNKVKDLFGKCNDDPACHREKPVRPLRRIMAFQRQSYLHDSEAEQDQAYRTDQAEHEIRQVVDNSQRISACRGHSDGSHAEHGHGNHRSAQYLKPSFDHIIRGDRAHL